jgi:type II secretory pathway pseudopilin PulG
LELAEVFTGNAGSANPAFLHRLETSIDRGFAAVRRNQCYESMNRNHLGFTLMELLVSVGLITVFMVLMIPCWGAMSRSRARQAATGIVLTSMERARNAAITGKNNVWVIFRDSAGVNQASLRTLIKKDSMITPLGPWQPLPAGISFLKDSATLMQEHPPGDVLAASLNGQPPATGELFGALMFQNSGRIGIPLSGGTPLAIHLSSVSGHPPGQIILSRATGRATSQ